MNTIGLKFPRMIFVGADQTQPANWGNIYGDIQNQTDLIDLITSQVTPSEWGNISGNINNQTDLINLINSNISTLEWGNITGDINDQLDLQNELDDIHTRIDNLDSGISNLGNQVIKDITIDPGTTNTTRFIKTIKNPTTGSETVENLDLPLQSATNGGIMPSSAFNQIGTNTSNISTLQAIGRRYATQTALPGTLTSSQVMTIYQTVTGNTVPNDYDMLVSFDNSTWNYTWAYFTSQSQWFYKGQTQVNIATNTMLGIVQGDPSNGKISINLDGTMSANGLSNAITDIINLGNRITTVEGDVSNIQNDIVDINSELDNKVDKVQGKQLSTNDYTTPEKTKLAGIEQGAQVNVPQIQSDWLQNTNTSLDYIKNKPLIPDTTQILNDISDLQNNVSDLDDRVTQNEIDIENLYRLVGDDVNPNENYLILNFINNTGQMQQINVQQYLQNVNIANITELYIDFGNDAVIDLLLKLPNNTFDVYPGVQFKLVHKWVDDIPNLGQNQISLNTMIYTAKLQIQQPITGVIGNAFMNGFLSGSNIQSIDIDLSNITQTTIGDNFMTNAFSSCMQLKNINIKLPKGVTSIGTYFMNNTFSNLNAQQNCNINIEGGEDWTVTQIPNFFMNSTFGGGISNIRLFNTTNWYVTRIFNNFMTSTFSTQVLKNIELPDTTNWSFASVTMIGTTFISNTFTSSNTVENVTLKGGLWINTLRPFTTNSMGIQNTFVQNIKVDSALISTYQSSTSWSNITPSSKFISW